ncbi:hypothetical protein GB931_12740 [Modestobacter sp. I12A-02628]|uniref:Uncharacterized protein n=1 Tax=Goekera deserti TaxID=2497753 RepID=A0A7K3W9R4_9ACTN|nr:hypothetical protein [Goekera deserti]MPQ98772.1 hypothetical protein [Goekera deserti]NDI49730.1 hypothetical protein [Goekera deserti]NEL53077.1 hypothetical protein [Goekera deserti]
MSFIFGGVRGREDPELRSANRRSRMHIARDINDERTLASDDREPIRRGNHWVWLAVAIVAFGVLALVNGRGTGDVPLTADCTTPGIAAQPDPVEPGAVLQYRLTGPDGVRYVVTLDGEPVRGDAGSTVQYQSTDSGPALQLTQCVSPSLVLAAPAAEGPHELVLLRLADDGSATPVARRTVTVSSPG